MDEPLFVDTFQAISSKNATPGVRLTTGADIKMLDTPASFYYHASRFQIAFAPLETG
jgi:hypothetical protein